MAQPLISAQHMPGLPTAMPGGFQYRECRYLDSQHHHKYPSSRDFTSPEKGTTAHRSDKTRQRQAGPTLITLAAK
jgi:hypothetical protein